MPPNAELIENSYRQADGVTGGYANELWLVTGQEPIYRALEVTGLPRVGDPHSVVSTLVVRERTLENIIDKTTAMVRVDYRPASFDIGNIYSTSERHDDPLRLKLVWVRDNVYDRNRTVIIEGIRLMGGPGESEYDVLIERATRVYTVNAGGDIDAVTRAIIGNKGRLYTFGTFPLYIFILANGQARKLKNGQVIADYTFQALAGSAAIPLGTYPDQMYAIPECPINSIIFTSKSRAESGENVYTIKNINTLYRVGGALPGL